MNFFPPIIILCIILYANSQTVTITSNDSPKSIDLQKLNEFLIKIHLAIQQFNRKFN
jgi:hypothetical protein